MKKKIRGVCRGIAKDHEELAALLNELEQTKLATTPTHIYRYSSDFIVSFDGEHSFRTKSAEVIKDLAKHSLYYILSCFDADKENAERFAEFKKQQEKAALPPGYMEKYGAEDSEILKKDFQNGTSTKTHADGTPILQKYWAAAPATDPAGLLAQEMPELKKDGYKPIYENPAINAFMFSTVYTRIPGTDIFQAEETTWGAIVQIMRKEGSLTEDESGRLLFPQNNELTKQVFMFLLETLCHQLPPGTKDLEKLDRARSISFFAKDYAEICHNKDIKSTKEQIRAAANLLPQITFMWNDWEYVKDGKNGKRRANKPIKINPFDRLDDAFEINGTITIKFSMEMAKIMAKSGQIAWMSKALYSMDKHKYRYCVSMGYRLLLHFCMNNGGKENANKLSVLKLIEATPLAEKYNEVAKRGRHIGQQIIDPFEKNLDGLMENNILESWEYCGRRNKVLTKSQVEQLNYDEWLDLIIKYKIADFSAEELKRRKEQMKARLEKKNKKAAADKEKSCGNDTKNT